MSPNSGSVTPLSDWKQIGTAAAAEPEKAT